MDRQYYEQQLRRIDDAATFGTGPAVENWDQGGMSQCIEEYVALDTAGAQYAYIVRLVDGLAECDPDVIGEFSREDVLDTWQQYFDAKAALLTATA